MIGMNYLCVEIGIIKECYCVILCEVCLVSGFVWKDFEENGGKFILRNFIFVIFCKILVCVGKSILLYYGII